MNSREKKLVMLVAAAALYAVGDYAWTHFLSKSSVLRKNEEPDKVLTEARNAVLQSTQILVHPEQSLSAMKVLHLTQISVQDDPLEPRPGLEAAGRMQIDLAYTGYLAVGKVRMAVIGGHEYAEGDALEGSGEIVAEISEEKVLLKNSKNGTERVIEYSGDAPLQQGAM